MTLPTEARARYLERHNEVSEAIRARHLTLADLHPQEHEVRVNVFLAATGSDKVRGNAADQASLQLSRQIIQTKHEIDALMVELEDIRIQLAYG